MFNKCSELIYWLSIMRDHADFQITALSSREIEYIQTAEYFLNYFQGLLDEIKRTGDCRAHRDDLIKNLENFISFKKDINRALLQCSIEFNLPPTFINHMINEALEFHSFLTISPPPPDPFINAIELADIHRIWLSDASGHANAIASLLDGTETLLKKEAMKYKKVFDGLVLKSIELRDMLLRTHLTNGALNYLTMEAVEWVQKFIAFLEKLKGLRAKCMPMAAGSFSPVLPDHMMREEQYYLSKIKTLQHIH